MRPDEHAPAPHWTRRIPIGEPGTPCPDDGLLAGLAEGRLPPDVRAAVEPHVAACEACRTTVAAVADAEPLRDAAAASHSPAVARRLPWAAIARTAAAAAVLAAVGVGFLRLSAPAAPPSPDALLAAAARELAAADPRTFAGFRPIDASERAAGVADVERGGIRLLRPVGVVLSADEFVWEAPAAPLDFSLVVVDANGRDRFRLETVETRALWPKGVAAPPPGTSYTWEVSARDPAGRLIGSRAFTVAPTAVAERFAAARRTIDARVDATLRPLLLAHFAERQDLLVEAEAAARDAVAARPDDAVARETLSHLRQRLGWRPSEADAKPR